MTSVAVANRLLALVWLIVALASCVPAQRRQERTVSVMNGGGKRSIKEASAYGSRNIRPEPKRIFQYQDCGNYKTPVKIEKLRIFPSPIRLPGEMNIRMRANVTKQLPEEVYVKLTVYKKDDYSQKWTYIPCFHDIYGSCNSVVDMCTDAASFVDCPLRVGPVRWSGQRYKYNMSDVGPAIQFFKGDYRVELKLADLDTGAMLLCVRMELSVAEQLRHRLPVGHVTHKYVVE